MTVLRKGKSKHQRVSHQSWGWEMESVFASDSSVGEGEKSKNVWCSIQWCMFRHSYISLKRWDDTRVFMAQRTSPIFYTLMDIFGPSLDTLLELLMTFFYPWQENMVWTMSDDSVWLHVPRWSLLSLHNDWSHTKTSLDSGLGESFQKKNVPLCLQIRQHAQRHFSNKICTLVSGEQRRFWMVWCFWLPFNCFFRRGYFLLQSSKRLSRINVDEACTVPSAPQIGCAFCWF